MTLIDCSPDEFDVLCSYLSLPSSLADMFSQGANDIVSNLVSQWVAILIFTPANEGNVLLMYVCPQWGGGWLGAFTFPQYHGAGWPSLPEGRPPLRSCWDASLFKYPSTKELRGNENSFEIASQFSIQIKMIDKWYGVVFLCSLHKTMTKLYIYKLLSFRWCGCDTVRGKLADSASNLKSVRYPLAVNQLVPLPKDYSELINRVSTFTYVSWPLKVTKRR